MGLNFAVYESLKEWLVKARPFGLVEDSELSVTTRLACGAAAGTVGQTVAYPLDVIRRRMQMVGWKEASSVVTGDGRGKAPLEYNGMIDAFRKTVRHEGFGALYKGLVPNSVKVSLLHFLLSTENLLSSYKLERRKLRAWVCIFFLYILHLHPYHASTQSIKGLFQLPTRDGRPSTSEL